MLHNDACPNITVNPQTFDVFVDGVLATCEPARECRWRAVHAEMTQLLQCCESMRPSRDHRPSRRGARRHRRTGRLRQDRFARAADPRVSARGIDLAVITNDLVTKEDAERLQRTGLIDPERVSGGGDRRLSAHGDPRGSDAEHARRPTIWRRISGCST